MGFLSRGRSRNRPETPLSGAIKIVGFRPKNTFRFTGPFQTAIAGGTPFSLRSTRTYDVKEFDLHQFWCKLSP